MKRLEYVCPRMCAGNEAQALYFFLIFCCRLLSVCLRIVKFLLSVFVDRCWSARLLYYFLSSLPFYLWPFFVVRACLGISEE